MQREIRSTQISWLPIGNSDMVLFSAGRHVEYSRCTPSTMYLHMDATCISTCISRCKTSPAVTRTHPRL